LRRVKAIIYDCDGVLIDSRRSNEAFYNHILGRFGLAPITGEQLDVAQVSTARDSIVGLFAGSPFKDAALNYLEEVDNQDFLPLLTLEAGIKETLAALRPAHHLAVATNRSRSLPLVLERLGLAPFFELTVSSADVQHPKPHPECLLKILAHFKVGPAEALYVGDSEVDQQTAARAGVGFVAYKNSGLEALIHLDCHRDLLEFLGEGGFQPPDFPG
jgi:phosphoglycolate phosphatase